VDCEISINSAGRTSGPIIVVKDSAAMELLYSPDASMLLMVSKGV
jgi:hypothetical protein